MIILSFLRRYAPLLIALVIVVALAHSDRVTFFIGPVFYILELTLASAVCALFIRHLFMRRSLDSYVVDPLGGQSQFVKDWQDCDPTVKVILSVAVIITLFVGVCFIAASIAK